MRLRALTALERDRVTSELEGLRAKIADLRDLLASDSRILDVVVEETEAVAEKFGDERRTELTGAVEGISTEDLIVEEDMVVTLSHLGYIKRNPITLYRQQRRGGKGARGMETRDEDFVEHLGLASTHAFLLFFTNRGRVYWLKVHELPKLGRAARGKAIVNVLRLREGERVQTMLPVRSFERIEGESILLATRRGVVKKTPLSAYSNPRRSGIIAINLAGDDELIGVGRTAARNEVILASKHGKSIRFDESQVRAMGRSATGVRGLKVSGDDEVVGMEILTPGATILTVTEKGYGKRTPLDAYRIQNRGGQGIITIKTTERNGPVVGVAQVVDEDQLMLITNGGKVLRCAATGISVMGRNTQGVRIMDLASDETLVSIARLAEGDEARLAAGDNAVEPASQPEPEAATEEPEE
jgi:DNA gyrase subunit A